MTDDYILAGRPENSVTSVVLVNNTAKTIDITVPSGEKWILLTIKAQNHDNVDRVITIDIFNEVAKTIHIHSLMSETVNAGYAGHWPNLISTGNYSRINRWFPEVLLAGNTIDVVWAANGVSAGGTDADGLVIRYLKYDG